MDRFQPYSPKQRLEPSLRCVTAWEQHEAKLAKKSIMRRITAAACTMLLVAFLVGCTRQTLTQESCVVRAASTFVGAGSSEGHITVARNGQPCGMAFVQNGPAGTGFTSDPQIVVSPAHGSASARMSSGTAFLTYTPDRDFAGSDLFKVAFGPGYTLTVYVDVVAPP